MDLFGAALASSESGSESPDSDPDRPQEVAQAACLQIAHIIYTHAAKLRVTYHRYLDSLVPRPPRTFRAPSAESTATEALGSPPPRETPKDCA